MFTLQSSPPNGSGAIPRRFLGGFLLLCLAVSPLLLLHGQRSPGSAIASIRSQFAQLPLQFVPNVGQADAGVRLLAQGLGGTIAFARAGVMLSLPSAAGRSPAADVRLLFVGANPAPTISGNERLPGVVHYYGGNDPTQWQTDVPTYAGVVYRALYPGIDLHYNGSAGRLKGTYLVAPNANPAHIRWRYSGGANVQVDTAGNLAIEIRDQGAGIAHSSPASAILHEHAPLAWQTRDGARVGVAVRYALATDGSIGFALGSYDPTSPLVIDPTLTYATYFGGNSIDESYAIAVDSAGNMYIIGRTSSSNWPGATNALKGASDAFVTKLNAAGSAIVYSLYMGGSQNEFGRAIAVDSTGNAALSIFTESGDFPTLNPLIPSVSSNRSNAAVVKLDPGGTMNFSTKLDLDVSNASINDNIALDAAGDMYITGRAVNMGEYGVAAIKIKSDGSDFVYNAALGSSRDDQGNAIAVDEAGNAYITGETPLLGSNFPVTPNAVQAICGAKRTDPNSACDGDAFVSVINSDATDFLYSTYLGGDSPDKGHDIAVDSQGNITVIGSTRSQDFPIQSAQQASCPSGVETRPGFDSCWSQEVFVSKIHGATGAFIYSTFLGGTEQLVGDSVGYDVAYGLETDNAGNAYLAGYTASHQFPIKDALQPVQGGGSCNAGQRACYDLFVTQLSPNGTITFSTYLGANRDDFAFGLARDGVGALYLTGWSRSDNFPTTDDALQPNRFEPDTFQQDAIVVKIGPGLAQPTVGPTPPPGETERIYLPLVRR